MKQVALIPPCALWVVLLYHPEILSKFSPLPHILIGVSICLLSSRIIVDGAYDLVRSSGRC